MLGLFCFATIASKGSMNRIYIYAIFFLKKTKEKKSTKELRPVGATMKLALLAQVGRCCLLSQPFAMRCSAHGSPIGRPQSHPQAGPKAAPATNQHVASWTRNYSYKL